MGKRACEILAIYFLKDEKALDDKIFQGVGFLPMTSSLRSFQQENSSRKKEKNAVSKIQFLQKWL